MCFDSYGAVLDTSQRQRQYDAENPVQVVFAGATLPSKGTKSVGAQVRKCFPAIATVTTAGAHQPAAEIRHEFVDAEQGMVDLKFEIIAERLARTGRQSAPPLVGGSNGTAGAVGEAEYAVKNSDSDRDRDSDSDHDSGLMIVFTNTHFIADVVAARLSQMGISVALLHKRVHADARESAMVRVADGSAQVLVATDLASRGLDFPRVHTVAQFDLALDVTSYLHRAGRTGRAGRPGTVISFSSPGEMRQQIETALMQAGPNMQSFAELYSRNRSLRNKQRKSGAGAAAAASVGGKGKYPRPTKHAQHSRKKQEYKPPPASQVGFQRRKKRNYNPKVFTDDDDEEETVP